MQGSKYYSNTKVLSGVFERQDKLTKPIVIEEKNMPFHFQQRNMTADEQKKLLQQRIFEHPEQYVNTHVKCQICNKFIEIEQVNQHSLAHFDQQQRILQILNHQLPEPQKLPSNETMGQGQTQNIQSK